MTLHSEELVELETRYRANLINSLGGFKSLVLIGTKSETGNENLATFSSLFHLGADPALTGIIIRPGEASQNTLGNIMSTGQYTINHILPSFYKKHISVPLNMIPASASLTPVDSRPVTRKGLRLHLCRIAR